MFFHQDRPRILPIFLIIFGVALILNGLGLLQISFSIILGLLLLLWGISLIWKIR
jgi:hypothetical protein